MYRIISTTKKKIKLAFAGGIACALMWILFSTKGKRVNFGLHGVKPSSTSSFHLYSYLNTKRCNVNEESSLNFRYLDVKLVCKRREEPCYVWHWDVANWTLIYTNEEINSTGGSPTRFCPIPILGQRTAKIIYSNGAIEYPGCINEKYPCSQTMGLYYASYDSNLKLRVNRSPCCRKLLMDITQHTTRVFDKHNITYFFNGGAVIGLVRDGGKLIPYDTDTDLSVDFNDFDKFIQALPELKKPGYLFQWKPEYTKGKKRYIIGCTNKQCLTGPGIAFYSVVNGMVSAPVTGWADLPANFTLPPIRREFEGMEMSFPKEPVKYLDYVYGKDKWRVAFNCSEHYYGQCKT